MQCTNCGVELKADSKFCPKCGTKAPEAAPVRPAMSSAFTAAGDLSGDPAPREDKVYVPRHASPEPARPTAVPVWTGVERSVPADTSFAETELLVEPGPAAKPAVGKTCPRCAHPVAETSAFCGTCGYRFAAPAAPAAPVRRERSKKYSAPAAKNKVWIPIVAGVALLLVAALVIGLLSIAGGPLVKIGSAVRKTVKAGNFTADYAVEIDGMDVEGLLYADIDVKQRTVMMHTVIEMDGMEVTLAIYDGYMIGVASYGGYNSYMYQDIEDQLDEIFDAYEESEDKDLSEVLEQLNDLMYEYSRQDLTDYLDFDELETSLVKFAKAANREKWLKANAGYSKSGKSGETLYTFAPSPYTFLSAFLPYFETVFEDEDIYEDMMDSLDDIGDEMDDLLELECTIGVKSGYLSSISGYMDMNGDEVEFTVRIYDVNKTKLDEDELEDLLSDAKRNS